MLQKSVASFFSLQTVTLIFKKEILCESGLKQRYFPDECFLIRERFCEHAALVNLLGIFLKLKAVWSDS